MRFSIEAEQSVIGALLLDPAKLDDVLEIVDESDFYGAANRAIFKTIVSVHQTGKTADVITVADAMSDAGALEHAGGIGYLVEIANNTPSAANVKSYASIVADRAIERRITEAGQKIAEIGDDEGIDVDSKLDSLHSEIAGLERRDVVDSVPFDQLIKSRIVTLDGKFHGTHPRGMATGFKALDERYGGIGNTALWVLAARPAQGKTALAMNIAYNIARQGKEVLIFSMEMGKEELGDRLLASASGVNSKKIRSGQLEGEDWHNLSAGVLKLKPLKIHVIDIPAIDIHRAKAIARKFKRFGDIGLIVIDYLQLMTDSKAKSRFDEVSSVSRELKVLAKMIVCPVLALSQLNRSVETRPNRRPQMADLRESGQIEQDADIISFIYRDDYYFPDSPNKDTAELITAKFREGEVGLDILGTQLQFSRFIDFDPSSYVYDWSDKQNSGAKSRASFD